MKAASRPSSEEGLELRLTDCDGALHSRHAGGALPHDHHCGEPVKGESDPLEAFCMPPSEDFTREELLYDPQLAHQNPVCLLNFMFAGTLIARSLLR